MAKLKIMMIGGRRCGKTTILSKIKKHFNEVLTHGPGEGADLLSLITPLNGITELNNAQDCINGLFKNYREYEEFAIDENKSEGKTITTFNLVPIKGAGSLDLEFTDIPGEWCSFIPGYDNNNHLEDVVDLIKNSNVIIIAIDTPSLFEENGKYADYYNRIRDIKELFKAALVGDTLANNESQKMVLFVPLKCEKYIINANGTANINEQKNVCDKVEKHYVEIINFFKNYPNNITMAILPIVTIKEVEWKKYFAIDSTTGNQVAIYDENGNPKSFIHGNPTLLNSKFIFKPQLYNNIANGNTESQSLYCEQPLVYSLVYLFKHIQNLDPGIIGKLAKIPIIGAFFAALANLIGLFIKNKAYEEEAKRLQRKHMFRDKNGFRVLQNPLHI